MSASRPWLFAALVLTLTAAYFAPAEEKTVAPVPVERRSLPSDGDRSLRRLGPPERVLAIKPRTVEDDVAPVFATPLANAAPAPPPNPPAVPALVGPPLPPPAPALPFKAFGRYVEDGRAGIFVLHQGRSMVVRTGDVIDGQYRVERIDEQQMTLLYLPLNERQTLEIGPAP